MVKNLNYGQAVEALKAGGMVSRSGWNGKGMFVFMRPGDRLPKTIIEKMISISEPVRKFLLDKLESGQTEQPHIEFLPYLCMYAADGKIVNGWLASQTDMLAEDWCILA